MSALDVRKGDVTRFKPLGGKNQVTIKVIHAREVVGRMTVLAYRYRVSSGSTYGNDHAYTLPSTVEVI